MNFGRRFDDASGRTGTGHFDDLLGEDLTETLAGPGHNEACALASNWKNASDVLA